MKLFCAIAFSLTLVACGGGGGGGDAPSPTPAATPQLADLAVLNTWKSLVSSGGTWSTGGVASDGVRYDLTTVVRPRGTAEFRLSNGFLVDPTPYTPYDSVEVTTTTRRNGVFVGTDTKLLYLEKSSLGVAVIIDPASPSCIKAVGPTRAVSSFPALSSPNTSGLIFSGEAYVFSDRTCSDSNGLIGAPYHRLTWSYEGDNGLPLFCINYTQSRASVTSLQSSCFEAGAAAVGGKARVSVSSGSFSLTSRNY